MDNKPLAYRMSPMTLDEYAELVKDCLEILPEDIIIHRMTGDGDKKILIAPKWSEDKKNVLNTLKRVCDIKEN